MREPRDLSPQTLKSFVTDYFHAMRNEDLCTAHARYLHPDALWRSVDGDLNRAGIIHMGQEIHKFIDGPFAIFPGVMTAEEDRVAAEARSDIKMSNGARYRNSYHFLSRFEGDLIIEVHEHYDSAHANEIWRPYASDLMAQATHWARAPSGSPPSDAHDS